MSVDSQTINTHWYNEGWAWFVFSIPAISVPLGITMLVLSLNTNNALVVDDYYVQGKTINQRIERDTYASQHGISALVTASVDGLKIELRSQKVIVLPQTLMLRWIHVTQASLDGSLQLSRDHSLTQSPSQDVNISNKYSAYYAAWNSIEQYGHWQTDQRQARFRLHIESGNELWRLVGEPGTLDKPVSLSYRSEYIEPQ